MAKKKTTSSHTSKFGGLQSVQMHRFAHYTFLVGIALALVVGLFNDFFNSIFGLHAGQVYVTTFVLLGTIVGLINLSAKETMPFLIAALALMLAGIVNLNLVYGVGKILRPALSNIVVFVVPGAIILSIKTIWKLASD